ncbi:hypothetical protein Pan189_31560 [Stratiformator vulcanicus]|uniref:Uncharacterized protein n=1 Tax=Stratiformator vulcanicus TaxID=2527980 RepID=A0A517R4F5_9PLAN|nr:hypothetical protein Pan189_31560 [Stratiformator vulcanicus]
MKSFSSEAEENNVAPANPPPYRDRAALEAATSIRPIRPNQPEKFTESVRRVRCRGQ